MGVSTFGACHLIYTLEAFIPLIAKIYNHMGYCGADRGTEFVSEQLVHVDLPICYSFDTVVRLYAST